MSRGNLTLRTIKLNMVETACLLALTGIGLLPATTVSAQGYSSVALYSFTNSGGDGANPYAGLIADTAGNLYGTTGGGGTSGNGTVFELVNSSGSYTERVLYSFTNGVDGGVPEAGLVMDLAGNLYGTTVSGGASGDGTVFELVNSSGSYTEKVLYSFTGASGDGAESAAGLVMDSAGNLYGTTLYGGANGNGTVFELVRFSGSYTEKVLYSFTGRSGDGAMPTAGLVMDSAGNLFGTTNIGGAGGVGALFELVNSSGSYTEKVLYSFTGTGGDGTNPYAGLVMDAAGNLYGTTRIGGATGDGSVFELVNSSGSYTEKVVHDFAGNVADGSYPYAGLVMDPAGNLYGTTEEGGTNGRGIAFELVNSSGSFAEKVLHDFTGTGGDGFGPYAGALLMDTAGNLYGTTLWGGTRSAGTVFELVNPSVGPITYSTTTTLTSSLNPAAAGDSITLTATVTTSVPSMPATGQVSFFEGSMLLGSASLSNGSAGLTLDATAIGIGSYPITALFTPNANNMTASSGSLSQTVTESGVALTTGSNTFTGNQTFNGMVSASTFVGDGSGLSGVIAAALPNAILATGFYPDPSWIPSLSGSKITGSVASANFAVTAASANFAAALQATPAQCGTNQFSTGIAANGSANCLQPASANLSDSSNLVFNMQPNIFSGGKQTLAASANGYASLNIPNTGQPPSNPVMGDLWLTTGDSHLMFLDNNSATQQLAFLTDVSSSQSNLVGANNTFTGNNSFSQIIGGSVTGNAGTVTNGVYATNSYLDPAWITGLSGSKIIGPVASATTAATATVAGTATTAASATTAGDAAGLGGIAAANYARLDVGNNFTGDQSVTGNLSVTGTISGTVTIGNSGTPIKQHISVLVNARFPALSGFDCATANFTVAGTSDGDTIALGVPNAMMNLGGHVVYTAWVSAANTVTIQACNINSFTKQSSAGTGSIRIDAWMY